MELTGRMFMVRGSRLMISFEFKVNFYVKNNSVEFLFGPISQRINVKHEFWMKLTWNIYELATEGRGTFLPRTQSGTLSIVIQL